MPPAEEWRRLGFYCEPGDHEWRFVGSRAGLRKFCQALRDYVADPRNVQLSEHEHYGPYLWLEVCTWDRPMITDHAIFGTLWDLDRLASLIGDALDKQTVGGRFEIDREYALDNSWRLVFEVRADGFDPAEADHYVSPMGSQPPEQELS